MKLRNVALGVEISTDRMHTSIAAAAAVDGRVAVALIEYLDVSDHVVEDDLVEIGEGSPVHVVGAVQNFPNG